MRIVHVEDFFHPDAGYQVNVLSKLQSEQGHEVFVVTSELDKIPDFLVSFFGKENIYEKDEAFYNRTGVKVIRIPLFAYCSGRSIFKLKIFREVDLLIPDIVFVHGKDTMIGMQFIWRSIKKKYPIFLDCHMLEMASENRFRNVFRFFYKHFVTPFILKYKIPLARVVDSDYVEKFYGIPLDKTYYLPLGTDVDFFKPDQKEKNRIRSKFGLKSDDFVVLYAGKLDKFKGGDFFSKSIIDNISLDNENRNIVFIVVGNVDKEIGSIVEGNFENSKNKVIRFSTQAYLDLIDFYQVSDIAVYPKQCSMSFFEAQSCGLPVVFENNEINLKRASSGGCFTFSPGDSKDFINKITMLGNMDSDDFSLLAEKSREYVVENCSFIPVAEQCSVLMKEEIDRFRKINDF
jgi:glycosyltransferase involved in cell wall biosynthesis